MANPDKLPTIGSDAGPVEPLPVMVFDATGELANVGSRLQSLGYMQYVLSTTAATAITPPEGTRLILLKLDGDAQARFRDDGVDPTATMGMPLFAGESTSYDARVNIMRVIGSEAGAILNAIFYGVANGQQ